MSKQRRDAIVRPYYVGEIGNDRGMRHAATSQREAVRQWCSAHLEELRATQLPVVIVWVEDALDRGESTRRWVVDLSYPPAFLIEPDKQGKEAVR